MRLGTGIAGSVSGHAPFLASVALGKQFAKSLLNFVSRRRCASEAGAV
jgi:hypothetical protein